MANIIETIRQCFTNDKNNRLQIGTVVTSILSFEKFSQLNEDPDPNSFKPSVSKWAPLDGRNVSGSLLAQYTNTDSVPDARGMFLRGLTSFDTFNHTTNGQLGDYNDTRVVGEPQQDTFQGHWHVMSGKVSTKDNPNGHPVVLGGSDDDIHIESLGPNFDKHNYIKSPKDDGTNGTPRTSTETRPKNIVVYYYVKIN